MTQKEEEQKLENKIRIIFGIVIIGIILYAMSSCAVENVDCDAYSYQHNTQSEVVS